MGKVRRPKFPDRRYRWINPYYRIRKGRIECVRAHWWPKAP
jgi:hypothetical protein